MNRIVDIDIVIKEMNEIRDRETAHIYEGLEDMNDYMKDMIIRQRKYKFREKEIEELKSSIVALKKVINTEYDGDSNTIEYFKHKFEQNVAVVELECSEKLLLSSTELHDLISDKWHM